MATLPHEIKMTVQPTGRPCWAICYSAGRVTKVKAFLHLITTKYIVIGASPLKGGHPGGQISKPVAIVETEDGNLCEVEIESVQLLDTAEQLEENAPAWAQKEESEQLKQREGETDEEFAERAYAEINEGKYSINTAREGLGLPPIEGEEE